MNNVNLCVQCDPTCASCTTGNDPFACTSCNPPHQLDPARGNCFFLCPVKKYKDLPVDPMSQTCTDCDLSCSECMGPLATECIHCPLDRPLESSSSINVFEDSGTISTTYTKKGECIAACPASQFFNHLTQQCEACSTGCLACRDIDYCVSCVSSYELHRYDGNNASCKNWCNPNEYRANTIAGTCTACHESCKSCSKATFKYCKGNGCQPGFEKLNENTTTGIFQCFKICDEIGEYRIVSNGTCGPCDPSCSSCTGSGSTHCKTCKTNFVLNKNTPSSTIGKCECPQADSFFLNGLQCSRCHLTCQECTGASETQCTVCKTGLKDLNNLAGVLQRCALNCPRPDQFYNTATSMCVYCSGECTTCTGPSNFHCLSCPVGKLLYNGICLNTCPYGWASSDNVNCIECTDANCKDCVKSNPDICIACNIGFAPVTGSCTTECPEGKVLDPANSACKKCQSGCRICTLDPALPYATENLVCTGCTNFQEILHEGGCVKSCPEGSQKVLNGG